MTIRFQKTAYGWKTKRGDLYDTKKSLMAAYGIKSTYRADVIFPTILKKKCMIIVWEGKKTN